MPTIYKNNRCQYCGKMYTGFGYRFCSKRCADKNSIREYWQRREIGKNKIGDTRIKRK